MKKLYILTIYALAFTSLNAQTYLSKDFDDNSITSGGWTVQEPTPAITPGLTWVTSMAGGAPTPYAKISNYNGTGNELLESWMISPATDLSGSTTPTLSFDNAYSYIGNALELMISTDYDGTSAPSTAIWTSLTSSATWSTGFFAWASSGDIDLSAYKTTGVYIAFKYLGSASDGSTWEVEDILVNETGAVVAPAASVYDVQYTIDINGNSPLMNTTVSTGGIVTAIRADFRYYIQSGTGPWSGVYVFNTSPVNLGDSVTFEANVAEFNGLTELTNVANFTIVSSGNPVIKNVVPTGDLLTAPPTAEQYEGVLVQILGPCTIGTNGFGEWTVNDGSGDCVVDDFMLGAPYLATAGNTYDVTGIFDYAFGSFLLQPRTLNDIINSTGINENNLLNTSVYPNPSSDFVNIEAPANSTVTILSIEGKVVINTTTNNAIEMIDISALESGSYIVSITNNNASSTEILVVK